MDSFVLFVWSICTDGSISGYLLYSASLSVPSWCCSTVITSVTKPLDIWQCKFWSFTILVQDDLYVSFFLPLLFSFLLCCGLNSVGVAPEMLALWMAVLFHRHLRRILDFTAEFRETSIAGSFYSFIFHQSYIFLSVCSWSFFRPNCYFLFSFNMRSHYVLFIYLFATT